MKKQVLKRVLSMLLVVMMAVSVLPMSAMAAFTVGGVGVNVNFGGEVDPNVLAENYDLGAVGAIKLAVVGSGTDAKLQATGEIQLLVPKTMFDEVIEDKADDMVTEHFDNRLTTELGKTHSVTKSVTKEITTTANVTYQGVNIGERTVTFPVTVSRTISGTPAQIVDTLLNGQEQTISVEAGTWTGTVNVEGYGDIEVTVEYGAQTVTVVYRDVIDELAALEEFAKQVLIDYVEDNDDYANEVQNDECIPAWAAATLNGYDTAATAGAKAAVVDAQLKQLAAVYAAWHINSVGPIPSVGFAENDVFDEYAYPCTYRSYEYIRGVLLSKVVARAQSVLATELPYLYGTVAPRKSLRQHFDGFVNGIADEMGVELGMDLPTQQLDTMENALKEIVAEINGVTDASTVQLTRTIIGYNNEPLTKQTSTGIYVVAGVNMDKSVGYEAHVIAPDLVNVTIKANGEDKGAFLKTTVGETDSFVLSAEIADKYNAENLMQLRIAGLTTSGKYYDSDKTNDLSTPADAGVYTVLSIYLDEVSLAMGADIAVLVVEPADTPADAFKFTDDLTVTYDGAGHFPGLTNTLGHTAIKGAVNAAAGDAYVILPGAIKPAVGTVTDKAESIINRLNKKAQGLHLPTNGLTIRALEALEELASYATPIAGRVDDGASITGAEAKAYLNEYLAALEAYYSYDNVKAMASKVYGTAKDTIADAENNATVQKYKDMLDSVMAKYESFNSGNGVNSNARGAEESLTSQFLNLFMEKTGVNRDNMVATVRSVLDYAVEVSTEKGNKYLDDAQTLVNTVGAISGASKSETLAAAGRVEEHYNTMVAAVKADVKAAIGVNSIDGLSAQVLENYIKGLDEAQAKALVVAVLRDVETFVKASVGEAKTFVTGTSWAIDTVYFNVKPSEIGVYDCYAVNVNPNYIPNLATATLTIKAVEEPQPEEPIFSVFGHNVRLQDLIKIGFYFQVNTTEEYEEFGTLLWTEENYSAETDFTVNSALATKASIEKFGNIYSAQTDGIYAQKLGTVYYAIPYIKTASGYIYGEADSYSVLDYAATIYNWENPDEQKAAAKTLVIDLLNYATAARTYFGYTEGLAEPAVPFNSILSDADKVVEWTESLKRTAPVVDETGSFAASYYGLNTNLLEAINLGIYFRGTNVAGGYYWNEHAYTSNATHDATTKSGNTKSVDTTPGYVKEAVTGIYSFNIYDNYYVRVYNAGGELSDTYGINVAAYLTKLIDVYGSNTDAQSVALVALCKAMQVYGFNADTNIALNGN